MSDRVLKAQDDEMHTILQGCWDDIIRHSPVDALKTSLGDLTKITIPNDQKSYIRCFSNISLLYQNITEFNRKEKSIDDIKKVFNIINSTLPQEWSQIK